MITKKRQKKKVSVYVFSSWRNLEFIIKLIFVLFRLLATRRRRRRRDDDDDDDGRKKRRRRPTKTRDDDDDDHGRVCRRRHRRSIVARPRGGARESALLALKLVDAVAITDPAFGTDPVFRAELILPTTLRVETYTHLSVEMLDEEMTKVVGFGTMDFQELVVENKGKIPGKWIAMWDDARENVVGHVCIRVTLEVVDRKEKMKNGVLQTTPAAGVPRRPNKERRR